MNKLCILALAVGILTGAASRAATPPSIEDFASRPKIEDVSISPDGRYLAVNEAWLRLHGYERSELEGHGSLSLGVWAEPADRARIVRQPRRRNEIELFLGKIDAPFPFRQKRRHPLAQAAHAGRQRTAQIGLRHPQRPLPGS